MIKTVFLFVVLSISFSINSEAQDWPDWRGRNRNAVLDEHFAAGGVEPVAVWSVPVGSGYSGPAVADGKVFLTDLIEEPVQTEGVLCFEQASGKKLWEFRYECPYEGVGYPAGPRASVVYETGKVWSLGTMGHLYCFDAASGKILWHRDLNREYEINMPIWGIAATPLIEGNKIIVQAGGSKNSAVVAFDKNNGKELWRNLEDKASYSAPIIIEKNGTRVLVVWTEDHLAGMNPVTGEVHWKFPWKLKMGMGISTPVWSDDYLFVSAFYNGSLLVHLGDDYTTAEKVWQREGKSERETDALHCVINTSVIKGQYIYGVDSYGELRCLELLTGNRVWEDLSAVKKDRWANIHFISAGRLTLMFNEHGELLVTELSPKGLKILSRDKVIAPTKKQLPRGVTWSHPAFADQHMYIRNDMELISVRLKN